MESKKRPPLSAKKARLVRLTAWAALVLVYLVVLAGGTVRATGSGMGCPDWPLCYGQLVPPTSVAQLPKDYASRWAVEGHPAVFDAAKTWIEYTNRLMGVLAGLGVLALLGVSLTLWRQKPSFTLSALGILILIAWEAWLGKNVVGTFLAPYAVSLHMVTALLLVALLVFLVDRAHRFLPSDTNTPKPWGKPTVGLLLLVGLLLFIQILLGIRVREGLPLLAWHRLNAAILGASILIFLGNAWKKAPSARSFGVALLVLTILQIGAGLILEDFATPALAQVIHLGLAFALFAVWVAAVVGRLPYRSIP
ncbi:MAG: hypothetical protein HKM06_04065 [Spirochaetales bacterium]|nr:hypothetical protein [Spirochaetales bacterium]